MVINMKPPQQISSGSLPGLARVTITLALLLFSGTSLFAYRERIQTKRDIEKAKATAEDIDIRKLPLESYPLLTKFKRARQIQLANLDPSVATDANLEALSRI